MLLYSTDGYIYPIAALQEPMVIVNKAGISNKYSHRLGYFNDNFPEGLAIGSSFMASEYLRLSLTYNSTAKHT